jgi:hypothetical protein
MTKDKFQQALEAAYLAGFNASGEGYNGEYPFEYKNRKPQENDAWCKNRDKTLMTIDTRISLPDALNQGDDSPEYVEGWNECREVMAGMMK